MLPDGWIRGRCRRCGSSRPARHDFGAHADALGRGPGAERLFLRPSERRRIVVGMGMRIHHQRPDRDRRRSLGCDVRAEGNTDGDAPMAVAAMNTATAAMALEPDWCVITELLVNPATERRGQGGGVSMSRTVQREGRCEAAATMELSRTVHGESRRGTARHEGGPFKTAVPAEAGKLTGLDQTPAALHLSSMSLQTSSRLAPPVVVTSLTLSMKID